MSIRFVSIHFVSIRFVKLPFFLTIAVLKEHVTDTAPGNVALFLSLIHNNIITNSSGLGCYIHITVETKEGFFWVKSIL
jgi:hypothetical protein